jgi:hypothetical protein
MEQDYCALKYLGLLVGETAEKKQKKMKRSALSNQIFLVAYTIERINDYSLVQNLKKT